VSTIEELLERKSRGSGLEIREYGRYDVSLYVITSMRIGGGSVGIVCSRTQVTKFRFLVLTYQE
jgi:hypothetical protein